MSGRVLAVAVLAATIVVAAVAGRVADPAPAAPAAPAVDFYISGDIVSRVKGRNQALVDIKWDFKCLGDQLGEATYDWTITVVRRQPKPEVTTTVATGTSKRGSVRRALAPGQYEPIANPFRCETDRGAGSTASETGRTFAVPDYCAWTVTAAKGDVRVEQRGVVKAARRGDTVRAGDGLSAGARSGASLVNKGADGALTFAAGTRAAVDASHCSRTGGWNLAVSRGSLTGEVKASADGSRRYEIESPTARTTAGRAKWTVTVTTLRGRPATRVKVLRGKVTVRSRKSGKQVVVAAGRSTTVD